MENLTEPYQILAARARRQRRDARIINFMVRFLMALCFLILPLWYLYLVFVTQGASYLPYLLMPLVYGVFFIMPFLISLPVVLPLALRHRNIARIVIFRKFNHKPSWRALRRILRYDLSGFGHLFTLSDSRFKIKWYVRIPVFIGQFSFFHFRQRTIRKPAELARLEKRLSHTTWLNVNWLLTAQKVFAVKTNDDLWRDTAKILLKGSSLVLFDITQPTPALEWEVKEATAMVSQQLFIFIASGDFREEAVIWKEKFDQNDSYDIPLFFYTSRGRMEKQEEFQRVVSSLLALRPQPMQDRSENRYVLGKTLWTSGIMFVAFLILLFFLSPYLLPRWVGMNTPFPRQAVRAFIQEEVRDNAGFAKVIRGRLRAKWPLKAAELSIEDATDHDVGECLGVQRALPELADPAFFESYRQLAADGESAIADSAAAILKRLRYPLLKQAGFDFLYHPRIDTRARGAAIIDALPADTALSGAIVAALLRTPGQTLPEPVAHAPFVRSALTDEQMHQLESTCYLGLYGDLKGHVTISQLAHLTAFYDRTVYLPAKVLIGLVLADKGDARGLPALVACYPVTGTKRFLVDWTTHPYQDWIDAAVKEMGHPVALPVLRELATVLDSIRQDGRSDSVIRKEVYSFVTQNYPPGPVLSFFKRVAPGDMALHYMLGELFKRGAQVSLLNELTVYARPGLLVQLEDKDPGIRTEAALPLARIGDAPGGAGCY